MLVSLGGFGVVCDDLEGQRRFYRDVMGIRVAEEGDGWVKFDMGPGVSFELLRRSTDPQYDRARYQVGFAVEDIEAARRGAAGSRRDAGQRHHGHA